jgi:bacterial low temperature requirement A protein (ltrA)
LHGDLEILDFHAAKFEIGALPVIVILFAMFTVYVMQFSYFIDEHKAQNSGALPSYSHYAVLIGIALATVALAWLHQNSTATAESARMLWLGLGVFYLGVAANTPHNKPEHRRRNGFGFFRRPYSLSAQG